jgi:hypothetical protein
MTVDAAHVVVCLQMEPEEPPGFPDAVDELPVGSPGDTPANGTARRS